MIHLGGDCSLSTKTQLVCHVVHPLRHQLICKLQCLRPQLQLLQLFFQGVNIIPLPIKMAEKLVLLFVNICVSCVVAVSHGLGIHLDLSQVPLHLVLLLF